VLRAAADAHADVRQAAVYGLGVCAQFGTAAVQQAVPSMVQVLTSVIQQPDSRDEDHEDVTDNAISALGKVCEFQRGAGLDTAATLGGWLDYLPVKGDKEEGCIVHEQLVRLVEAQDAALLGAQNERLPKVATVFAQVMNTDLATAEVTARMKAVLLSLQPMWGQLFVGMSPTEQQAFQQLMTTP